MRIHIESGCCLVLFVSFGVSSVASQEPSVAEANLRSLQRQAAQLHDAGKHTEALSVVKTGLKIAPSDSHMLTIGAWCCLVQARRDPKSFGRAEEWFANASRVLDVDTRLASFELARGRFHLLASGELASGAESQRHLRISEACFSSLIHEDLFVYEAVKGRFEARCRMASTSKAAADARRFIALSNARLAQLEEQAKSTKVKDFRQSVLQHIKDTRNQASVVRASLGLRYWRSGESAQALQEASQLLALPTNEEPKVAELIATVMPDDVRAIPSHAFRVLHADKAFVRASSALLLARCDSAGVQALPVLVSALDDSSLVVLREAVTALGMIRAFDDRSISKLKQLARHADAQIASRAKVALKRHHGK